MVLDFDVELLVYVLKSNRNYEAPPTHVSKKPLSLRQENSRAGAAETRRELKKDPTEANNTYSVAKKKERTISDSSQRAKLHVSNKSSSLSGQFTDIKKVKPDLVRIQSRTSCLLGEECDCLPGQHCQQPCLAQQGQNMLLFKPSMIMKIIQTN